MAEEEPSRYLTPGRLQVEIDKHGYKWRSGYTSVAKLTRLERQLRLGLDVQQTEVQRVARQLAAATARKEGSFKRSVDWSNFAGPVQDQGSCGSCVAFATVATLEAQARIHYKQQDWAVDLSEADLFFCGAGRMCNKGWWPADAMDRVTQKGVPAEGCFPYTDKDQDCKIDADRENRLVTAQKSQEIIDLAERKEWLSERGPLVACMAVYEDFFYYQTGIYRHIDGDLMGYHAVSCVGYDEDEKCWICKNSWGKDWGENGFFKVGYGEVDMDTRFATFGLQGIGGTLKPTGVEDKGRVDYLVLDEDFSKNRNLLFAHVNGQWRHRIMTNSELAASNSLAAASDELRAWYQGDKILRLSGHKILVETGEMMAVAPEEHAGLV